MHRPKDEKGWDFHRSIKIQTEKSTAEDQWMRTNVAEIMWQPAWYIDFILLKYVTSVDKKTNQTNNNKKL